MAQRTRKRGELIDQGDQVVQRRIDRAKKKIRALTKKGVKINLKKASPGTLMIQRTDSPDAATRKKAAKLINVRSTKSFNDFMKKLDNLEKKPKNKTKSKPKR